MAEERQRLVAEAADSQKKGGGGKSTDREVDKSDRLTGFEQFSGKVGTLNLEAMEAAAEDAELDEEEDIVGDDVDEALFDVDDDDLDDLDFDSDDDEPDI